MHQNISAEELASRQDEITDLVYAYAKEKGLSNDDIEPITDGVADVEKYLASKRRIMWILKEPYDNFDEDGNPIGGGWSITSDCFSGNGDSGKDPKYDAWKNRTWQPIIYSMYGYFNGLHWEDMNWIRDDKDMTRVLQNIAFINVSKMPNHKDSCGSSIGDFYDIWKKVLEQQINLYNPEVIIFANTFHYFKNDLGITNADITEFGKDDLLGAFVKDGILYLKAFHPNQKKKGATRERYVNSIIDAINSFDNR